MIDGSNFKFYRYSFGVGTAFLSGFVIPDLKFTRFHCFQARVLLNLYTVRELKFF